MKYTASSMQDPKLGIMEEESKFSKIPVLKKVIILLRREQIKI